MVSHDQLKLPDQLTALSAERGFSLLEMLGALAIGALIMMGLSALVTNSIDDVAGQQASFYQSQVVDAAKRYVADNGGSLPTGQTAVSIATLKTGNYLSASFATTNAFQQDTCVAINSYVVPATVPPAYAGPPLPPVTRLDTLIYTSGGKAIPDKDLPVVAANAGSGGGYVSTANPGQATGTSFSTAYTAFMGTACAGVATLDAGTAPGHLASTVFYGGPGDTADFLYRTDVPGHPELTRMNSPIRLANNALVAPGSSCADNSGAFTAGIALSNDASRQLMTCTAAGLWVVASYWKEPVNTFGDLAALSGTAQAGDVHLTLDTGRAFAFRGGAWTPLAADQNGNFDAEGTVNAGTLVVAGTTDMKGVVTMESNAGVGGNFNVIGNSHVGGDLTVDGAFNINTLNVIGKSTFGGTAQFNDVVTTAGNVNVGGDIAAQNANIVNLVKSLGMTATGYINGNSIQGTHLFAVGDGCEIPDAATGANDFPWGSIVINSTNYNPMYCSHATSTFQYIYSPS